MNMIQFSDRSSILLDDVKTLPDGYKVVRSKIARTGIQKYRGGEFKGQAREHGFADEAIVTVYRDPADVFAKDALNGWAGVPVTKGHPPELVTPDNVKQYQVGDVRDKAHVDYESGWLGLEYIVRDADAIAAFDSGAFGEVSGGYMAVIDWSPGITPDGIKYDAKQVNIVPNHLALVPRGRAFQDSAENWGASPVTVEDKETMTVELKTVILGDKAVSVEAKDAETVAAILADHKTIVETKDETIGELKAKLADAEAKFLDEDAIAALVAERVELNTKRDAVKAKFGDEAIEGASDAEIAGMFKVLDKAVAPSKAAKAIAQGVTDAAPDAEQLIADAIANRFNKGAK